ncbi:MAG: aldo/keto reductase [Anaerolineae bacterium]|nr:aldo/keto reductase [Anaerolineae bacterium]
MKKVPLGSTGIDVSILCLGAMHLGSKEDEATSVRLLDQYVEAGGSFIDTANIYAYWIPGSKGGESEHLLGKWMKQRGNRDRLFIASKVGFEVPAEGVARSTSAQLVVAECEKSLKRMGVETIDLYYAHNDDRNTPVEETLEAFHKLKKEGKVRFIGASNFRAWRLEQARWVSNTKGWAEYCCIQQRYTYLRPNPGADFSPQVALNDDLLDYCANRAITLLAYSPLLGGAYTRKDKTLTAQYAGPDADARLAALNAIAQEVDATPNQVILAWMMHSDPVVVPVMAASAEAQMQENLGALAVTLRAEQMARLNAAGA